MVLKRGIFFLPFNKHKIIPLILNNNEKWYPFLSDTYIRMVIALFSTDAEHLKLGFFGG